MCSNLSIDAGYFLKVTKVHKSGRISSDVSGAVFETVSWQEYQLYLSDEVPPFLTLSSLHGM